MLYEQLTKNLKKGESLVRVVQRDVISCLSPFLLAAFLILVDFFLLTFYVRRGPWGILAFCVVLLAGGIVGFRAVFEWKMNAFLLTNERIIHVFQRGLLTRTVSETTYDKVTDVRCSTKGLFQTSFGLGAVEVQTAGEGENLRIEGVRHPAQVQAFITDLLHEHRQSHATPLSAQELVAALTKMKSELGHGAFRDIISKVGGKDSGGQGKSGHE